MADWPLWRVFDMLRVYWNREQLYVTTDQTGAICGMVIAVPQIDSVCIEQIICTSTDAFKVLRAACRHKFPGQDLVYFRHKTSKKGRWPARKV